MKKKKKIELKTNQNSKILKYPHYQEMQTRLQNHPSINQKHFL